jgi:hypothetical protein
MNSKKGLLPLLLAALATVPAMPAQAITWGGDVFGAFNTHTMKDWNDAIDANNANLINPTDFNNIKSSFAGGLGLRILPSPNFMLEGTWEPLFPTTEDENTGDKYELTANSFQVTGTYFFPTMGKNKFGLAAGVGFYALNGKRVVTGQPEEEIGGSGVGFNVLGTGEWTVSPGFAIFGAGGYRMGKVGDTEFDGQGLTPKFETDFSGLTLRAGLAFYASSSTP